MSILSVPRVPQGICAACVYGDDCALQAGSERMILQCGQFELAFPEANRHSAAPSRALPVQAPDSGEYAGLCASCEKRETCTYIKPEGGIWRCEEYT